ncbi:MAG: formate/nitrite transporter family protein [Deltaproteobacteria bacterium]|nr:formate/nitrite transporter family protein [Deltaproteobacteria bacterium]
MKDKEKKEPTYYEPALSTSELVRKISALGIKKANTKVWQLFILAMLAGLYIGLGAQVFLVALEQGMGKIVGGMVFSVGLVLVVIAGAELFTGNIMMIVSSILSLYTLKKILKNWITVYVGNFIGSVLFAILIWKSGLLGNVDKLSGVGMVAASVAETKVGLAFSEAFIRGVFCNMLVILAIILATIAKDVISKITSIVLPIMVFVACGFEHCVANMYLIPVGLLAKGAGILELLAMFNNIIPVTLGNIVGGVIILVIHPNRIRQLIFLFQHRKEMKIE